MRLATASSTSRSRHPDNSTPNLELHGTLPGVGPISSRGSDLFPSFLACRLYFLFATLTSDEKNSLRREEVEGETGGKK